MMCLSEARVGGAVPQGLFVCLLSFSGGLNLLHRIHLSSSRPKSFQDQFCTIRAMHIPLEIVRLILDHLEDETIEELFKLRLVSCESNIYFKFLVMIGLFR